MSGGDFFPVPRWVVGRRDISIGSMLCLGALYGYERKGRAQWPCVAQLVADLKAPRRTVTRWLEELTEAGLCTSVRDGREVRYAPSTCAKTGAPRDLDPGAEHEPEMAHVPTPEMAHVSEGHTPTLAHVPAERTPTLAHVARSTPLSGSERREEERSERAREFGNEHLDNPHDPKVRGALVRGYAQRYQQHFERAWMSASKAAGDIDLVARWCGTEADPLAAAEAVLDGAFADSWLVDANRRVPWGPIAKDPARYADAGKGSAKERAAKHLATVKRKLEWEKNHGTEDRARELQAELDDIVWGPADRGVRPGAVPAGADRRDGPRGAGQGEPRALRGIIGGIG